ncbi:CAAX prenyl protease 2 isoform X3 [Eptesicus fuscus]|uniref:CAAX prenyl protease 2 isoform X3 n=1 Tax=Myotis lucifugus TaxID=59463 RepID=UPI000CCC9F41|nr:CAAX prenyl protease 2 isoform X3 [Myotis lucifugus]XP_028009610.1 CAAX prenyl protease 2 isoform X3 [Eptesicus fuscus]
MAALGGDGLRLLSVSRPERQPESAALGGPGPGLCCWVSVFSCLSLACSYVGSLYVWKSELPRHIPAHADGLQAGGHFPSSTAAPAADHAPRSWARCLMDMRWLRNQVIAPLTEELVFRACMLPMLAPCTGLGPAVFTCPLFFGVAHFHHIFEQLRFRQSSVGSIFLSAAFQFSYTAVFGAYTAFLFIRTGHLIGPVLCHSFCNYMGFPAVCAALEHPQRRPLLAGYALGVGLFLLLLQPLTDPKLYGSLPLCVLLEQAGDSEAPLCS